MADNNSFMANRSAIEARLAAGDPVLAARLSLRPGVEVRASGNLAMTADYVLPSSAQRNGQAPMTLTLRAAGNLLITQTISDGFSNASAAAVVQPGPSASLRLIGGADLAAADPRSVLQSSSGDVIIGRPAAAPAALSAPAPDVLVRTSTGRVEVAAARDVQLLNDGVRIYTTGLPVDVATLPAWPRLGLAVNQTLRQANGSPLGPFFQGAGDISLQAGRDVLGSMTRQQYVTDWWWRQTSLAAPGTPAAWWARYDLFRQGIASFGGGDVRVSAGRDVQDIDASTPASGYSVRSTQAAGLTLAEEALLLPGGSLIVSAGRDVVSGLLYGGGAIASVSAGGQIRPAAVTTLGRAHPGLQLIYAATDWTLQANGSITLGSMAPIGLLQGVVQGTGAARIDVITGLDNGASLDVLSLGGSIGYTGSRTPLAPSTDPRNGISEPARQAPADLRLAAPAGSVSAAAPLQQRPAGSQARLQVLAGQDVTLRTVTVGALSPAGLPQAQARLSATNALSQDWRQTMGGGAQTLDTSSREPVQLVAREGSVTLDADLRSARPLVVVAGQDIVGRGSASLSIQHQADDEISVLRAGHDFTLANNSAARLRLAGPGDLLILAGRDVDLQSAAGIQSVGNQDNARLLAEGGARVTVVAGVNWGVADYEQALLAGLQLRGGGVGLQALEGELWVALQAVISSQGLPSAGSPALAEAAAAFRALNTAARAERVRGLVGDGLLQRLRQEAMRTRGGEPELEPGAADAAYAGLDTERRREVDAAVQALALADALGARLGSPLSSPLSSHLGGGTAGRTALADYTRALYAGWTPERRALRLHDVLFAELRAAGRQAARLPSGPDRDAAYAPGYAALALLYPGERGPGDIRLTASQIKSQQGGSLRLLAPGGGIDAGALAGSVGKPAEALGIITTSGGHIEAAARVDFAVNQSRVFTLARGDLLLWSSEGNIDAGRGAKTVTGAPPPVLTIDRDGNVVVDTSGSFSGSGIAVLDSASTLDLYAPKGEISAGEAGIASRGTAFLGAQVVRGDDIQLGAGSVGAPPAPDTGGATAGLALASSAATTPGATSSQAQEEEEDRRKRRARRNLLLEFLGFGNGP